MFSLLTQILPVLDDFSAKKLGGTRPDGLRRALWRANWLMRLEDSESPLIADINREMPWTVDIGSRRK